MNEFEKYATRHCGINSLKLHDFRSQYAAYVSPTIIEERQLNVATMDVFSRLMMDRIIFWGLRFTTMRPISSRHSCSSSNLSIPKRTYRYILIARRVGFGRIGIYDTMQLVNSDVATICTGLAASMAPCS